MSKQQKKDFTGAMNKPFATSSKLIPVTEDELQTPAPPAEMPEPVNPKEEEDPGDESTSKRGRPRKHSKDRPKSEEGLKEGYKRHSIIVHKDTIEIIKDLAYWQRITITEVVENAIQGYVEDYEKQEGPLKDRPAGK